MTPTEQDKELSEKLRVMIRGYLRHYTDSARDSSVYANEVLSLITADRKRIALEARIDELDKIPEYKWDNHKHCLDTDYVTERIAELKAQKEKSQ